MEKQEKFTSSSTRFERKKESHFSSRSSHHTRRDAGHQHCWSSFQFVITCFCSFLLLVMMMTSLIMIWWLTWCRVVWGDVLLDESHDTWLTVWLMIIFDSRTNKSNVQQKRIFILVKAERLLSFWVLLLFFFLPPNITSSSWCYQLLTLILLNQLNQDL